jgi:hypothetical protein
MAGKRAIKAAEGSFGKRRKTVGVERIITVIRLRSRAEAGKIPDNGGPAGELALRGEIGQGEGGEASEDIEVAAGPGHLLGHEAAR